MTINRYESNGRMSKVVEHNGVIYLCGQTCYEPGKEVRDVKGQTQVCLDKIDALLHEYGSSKKDILNVTIYLKDCVGMFKDMNEVYDAWVEKGHEPARACVEGKLAVEEVYVEFTVVAAKSE